MPLNIDSKVIESFHLMYDDFPEPAMLIHKSREMLAVNKACKLLGVAPGMFCNKQGKPEVHKGCLADKALKAQCAAWMKYPAPNRPDDSAIAFWLPVNGYPDIYVHFAVGNAKNYTGAPTFA